MKNLIKLSLVLVFILAATYCFSQTQSDPKKTDKTKTTTTTSKKNNKVVSPSSKGKITTGTSNKIAVSDHGLPADKSGTKKTTDKDKAVVPKKTK